MDLGFVDPAKVSGTFVVFVFQLRNSTQSQGIVQSNVKFCHSELFTVTSKTFHECEFELKLNLNDRKMNLLNWNRVHQSCSRIIFSIEEMVTYTSSPIPY